MLFSKLNRRWLLSLAATSLVVVAFQNCGQTGGPGGVTSSSSTSASTAGRSNSTTNESSGEISTTLKVYGSSNSQAQMDCSVAPAAMSGLRVEGADADVRLCAEYVLDMPMGSARYGEKNLCNDPSKFGPPAEDWLYNADLRIWHTNDSALPNHPVWVPGTYYLFAMNRLGEVAKSPAIVIKRQNATNCWASSGSTPTASPAVGSSCAWSGNSIVAGPVAGPSQSCSQANKGATATVEGRNYTCVCR